MFPRPEKLGVIAVILAFSVSACGDAGTATESEPIDTAASESADTGASPPAAGSDSEPVELTLGMIHNPTAPIIVCGADVFRAHEALSDANVSINLVHSAQLGSEPEMVQQVASGELELTTSALSLLGQWVPDMVTFEAYYLYENEDDVFTIQSGELAQGLFADLRDEANLRNLGRGWYFGVRNIFGTRAVRSLEDLEGLTLRVPEIDISIESARAMGAVPTPVVYGEIYLSMQQGLIEAAETTAASAAAESFDEPADYFNTTQHLMTNLALLINDDVWNSLSADQQAALETAANAASDRLRECVAELDQETFDEWSETGEMEVVEIDDASLEEIRAQVRQELAAGHPWSEMYVDLLNEYYPGWDQ